MKALIFLSFLTFFCITQSQAQQSNTSTHMVISITNNYGGKANNMFITRDDTAQVQKYVDLYPHVRNRDVAAAFENLLAQLIAPYYKQGWKLISTSAMYDSRAQAATYRYYFIKE